MFAFFFFLLTLRRECIHTENFLQNLKEKTMNKEDFNSSDFWLALILTALAILTCYGYVVLTKILIEP